MKNGIELIAEERARQISAEGWTALHDSQHHNGELAKAAACYAMPRLIREREENGTPGLNRYTPVKPFMNIWPWAKKWWKPTPNDRVRELVKAGALLAAEIDRLHRLGAHTASIELKPGARGLADA